MPRWAPNKLFALPVLFLLYKNRQGLTKGRKKSKRQGKRQRKSKPTARQRQRRPGPGEYHSRPQLLVEMLELFARWFPQRQIVVVADSAYGGCSVLQKLPANMDLISHVHPGGALYEPAPAAQPGQKGRRRKKGARLPGLAAWAADASQPWTQRVFDQYGFHATVATKEQQALYYKAGKDRLLRIVLVRDVQGKRPDQMFYCTRLQWTAGTILSRYAWRWAAEVAFENSKQWLGLEDPANRLPQAVKRTAPLALVLMSLVVLWFDQTGCRHLEFPYRPWYRHKREPSFADLLMTLRRQTWREKMGQLVVNGRVQEKLAEQLIELACRVG
jgi:hypothetical protein